MCYTENLWNVNAQTVSRKKVVIASISEDYGNEYRG